VWKTEVTGSESIQAGAACGTAGAGVAVSVGLTLRMSNRALQA
jgi:hypothetical protein